MGNSTISIQKILDRVMSKGIPTPLQMPAGYGPDLAIAMANDVMSEIIAERFNWKWNRKNATPFYTNSYQQDYPQLGITDLGWLEDCDRVEINNTAIPKPIRQLTCRRQLSRTTLGPTRLAEICWMYNNQLSYGTWPGANITFYPLVAAQTQQNPVMNMIDSNGNILIVTTFGKTGNAAPAAPLNSAEGVTVTDGTVVWTVVSGTSQGFRVAPLPGATGPVYQVIPYYQKKAPTLVNLQSVIDPVPDDYSRVFQAGMEAYCLKASPNPGDAKRGIDAEALWIRSMAQAAKQGDREADSYAMLPSTSPVENIYSGLRNPQDPGQPY